MRRSIVSVALALAVLGIISAACSGKSTAAAAGADPCTEFRPADAALVLGVASVKRISFREVVGSSTTTKQQHEQIAAVARSICTYGGGDSARVAYQWNFAKPSTFPGRAAFLKANQRAGSELVAGVGVAAVFAAPTAPATGGTIVVLLAGGKNFVIASDSPLVTKTSLATAARRVLRRV